MAKRYDTIVVGGGVAGLSAAAYLSQAKQSVLLIEKNNEFGGLVSSFYSDGFLFEAGVRALENAGIIHPMLEDLGIELEMIKSNVSVGVASDVVHIEKKEDITSYSDFLARLYPESKEDINIFIKEMKKIMKHLDVLYGIENPTFKNLHKDKEYLFKTLLPWLPKFIFTIGKINRLNKPVESYLKERLHNPALIDIISQHFFKGTPTFFALSYFTLYTDYFYPKGGVGQLAKSLEKKVSEYGGELQPNTYIEKVDVYHHYLTDNNGKTYQYKNLVWAADLKTLYRIADTSKLTKKIQSKFTEQKKKVLAHKGGESIFTLYLQVDLPLEYFAEIAHGHFFYTPSKAGLKDIHRDKLSALLQHWHKGNRDEVMTWFTSFLSLNSFEISIPGLKDAKLTPENKSGLIISFLADYTLFKKVQDDGWYEDLRESIEIQIITLISDSIYPELKQNIIKRFSFSPLNIKERIASSEGAIVGWSFEKRVPVLNKIQQSAKSVLTPLPSIYKAGQWAYSPAGVPMSILTGKLAADKIIKINK